MLITTTTDGTSAVVGTRGEITFDTLPGLLIATEELPASVTEVTWDLRETPFMDVAGLHLLVRQRLACQDAGRTLSVTGLQQQPLQLVQLAQELFPVHDWADFLRPGPAAIAA